MKRNAYVDFLLAPLLASMLADTVFAQNIQPSAVASEKDREVEEVLKEAEKVVTRLQREVEKLELRAKAVERVVKAKQQLELTRLRAIEQYEKLYGFPYSSYLVPPKIRTKYEKKCLDAFEAARTKGDFSGLELLASVPKTTDLLEPDELAAIVKAVMMPCPEESAVKKAIDEAKEHAKSKSRCGRYAKAVNDLGDPIGQPLTRYLRVLERYYIDAGNLAPPPGWAERVHALYERE
jgi:anion-transporting  ArsA/GET3 family ATPase